MIVAREQFSPYWLIAIREKALNKSDILKLQLPEAIEKLEAQFKVIPFKDASFVLTCMAKVINKKLDYCLIEINELIESCNNPNIKPQNSVPIRINRLTGNLFCPCCYYCFLCRGDAGAEAAAYFLLVASF